MLQIFYESQLCSHALHVIVVRKELYKVIWNRTLINKKVVAIVMTFYLQKLVEEIEPVASEVKPSDRNRDPREQFLVTEDETL